jgi:hypothetical protein
MVNNIPINWGVSISASPGIQKSKTFRKLDVCHLSEVGGACCWVRQKELTSVSETSCTSVFLRIQDDRLGPKPRNPEVLNVIKFNNNWNWNWNCIFWDTMPCSPPKANRRFGGTYRLHLQGRISRVRLRSHTCFHAAHLIRP